MSWMRLSLHASVSPVNRLLVQPGGLKMVHYAVSTIFYNAQEAMDNKANSQGLSAPQTTVVPFHQIIPIKFRHLRTQCVRAIHTKYSRQRTSHTDNHLSESNMTVSLQVNSKKQVKYKLKYDRVDDWPPQSDYSHLKLSSNTEYRLL